MGSGFELHLLAHTKFPTLAAEFASLSLNFFICRTCIKKYLHKQMGPNET